MYQYISTNAITLYEHAIIKSITCMCMIRKRLYCNFSSISLQQELIIPEATIINYCYIQAIIFVYQWWDSYLVKVTRYLLLLPIAKSNLLQLHITYEIKHNYNNITYYIAFWKQLYKFLFVFQQCIIHQIEENLVVNLANEQQFYQTKAFKTTSSKFPLIYM